MVVSDLIFSTAPRELPSNGPSLIRRGIARLQSGDSAGALDDFRACTRLRPDLPEAWNNAGLVLILLGRPVDALPYLERALTLRPDYPEALTNRGRVRQAAGDLVGARADFDRAVAGSSGSVRASTLLKRAALRHANADAAGAREDLDAVLELRPEDAGAFLYRGNLRKEAGDLAGALTDLDRALELAPPDRRAYAHYCRGGVRLQLRNFGTAVADFDAAVALEPDNAVFYTGRANARFHRCDRRCVIDYTLGLKLNPEKAGAEIVRIVVEHAHINPAEVLENCDRHLDKNPHDLIAHIRRGLTLRILGARAKRTPP